MHYQLGEINSSVYKGTRRTVQEVHRQVVGRQTQGASPPFAKVLITSIWKLRREPKAKATTGPDFYIDHIHFLWVYDTSQFHIELDRLDDAPVRQIAMYTGCRKHELVYAKPPNLDRILKTAAEDTDAYTDVENDTEECVRRRPKRIDVCHRP